MTQLCALSSVTQNIYNSQEKEFFMNELFVRGKAKDWKLNEKKEWIYGFYLEQFDNFGTKECFILSSKENGNWRQEPIDINTVASFTGFFDENTQPIWGNSSLKDKDTIYDVSWDVDIGAWMLIDKKNPKNMMLLSIQASSLQILND